MNQSLKSKIEEITRTLITQIGQMPEEKVQAMLNRLYGMSTKDVIEVLGMNVDSFFNGAAKIKALELLLDIDPKIYSSTEELVAKIDEDKAVNHRPGSMSVEDNHRLIEKTLKDVCDRLNDSGVDYYVVGALAAFIASGTPLFRYHGDLDFMINERDIEKVRKALEGTEYDFADNRLSNEKRYNPEVGHTQGEHEVIANHRENEFHLGFFLFERQPDNSVVLRGYFMQEQEGKKVPMVLETRIPPELASLEYSKGMVEFAGTKFRVSTPESVYAKKQYTRHPKDLLDIKALEGKVNVGKIEAAAQYKSTTNITPVTSRDISL